MGFKEVNMVADRGIFEGRLLLCRSNVLLLYIVLLISGVISAGSGLAGVDAQTCDLFTESLKQMSDRWAEGEPRKVAQRIVRRMESLPREVTQGDVDDIAESLKSNLFRSHIIYPYFHPLRREAVHLYYEHRVQDFLTLPRVPLERRQKSLNKIRGEIEKWADKLTAVNPQHKTLISREAHRCIQGLTDRASIPMSRYFFRRPNLWQIAAARRKWDRSVRKYGDDTSDNQKDTRMEIRLAFERCLMPLLRASRDKGSPEPPELKKIANKVLSDPNISEWEYQAREKLREKRRKDMELRSRLSESPNESQDAGSKDADIPNNSPASKDDSTEKEHK